MPGIAIRPFSSDDVPAAAELLAGRHRADRARLPMLSGKLEDAGIWAEVLDGALRGAAQTVAATRAGRLVGFLLADHMLFPPDAMMAQWIPPHSLSMGYQGHAVADGEDATDVVRLLYAEIAADAVRQGYFIHRVEIIAGDRAIEEAWVNLGFGRTLTAATRDTGPVMIGDVPGIAVHEAGAEDIDVVMDLAHTLDLHHATAPMFWPIIREAHAAARAFNVEALKDPATPYFVAHKDGRPAGMQTFLRPGFTPFVVPHATDVYLFEGVVDGAVRGGGVGTELLEHSMRWAREQGHLTCTLHFASGNPSGAPFWLRHGFVPVTQTMERRVDERIAWANQ
ncbi:MAG: GNAT family N-acetyltransferase [Thermoflexaceae bacterium]|nr:GNAT family N-acetyltransferase [Thermoflexaceae bacterium]